MKKTIIISFISIIISSLFCSCDDDYKMETRAGEYHFVHSVIVGDNVYVDLFKDLEVSETKTDYSLVFAKETFLYRYKNNLFVSESSKDKIHKYTKEEGDLVKMGKTLLLPSKSQPTNIAFVSDQKAYLSCTGTGILTVFNPSTMEVTKTIDLSAYSLGKDGGDHNPEPAGLIIRDNILYVCLAQNKTLHNPYTGAYIVTVDIATDTPKNMIDDQRASQCSAFEPSNDVFIDEKGDIYFYCVGGFGYIPGIKEGFLRIKKGEQEFDPDYFFPIREVNLEGVNGNYSDYVYQKVYAGNGIVYCYLNIPGNMSNPPDYVNDKTMQPFKLDIYNKTAEKMDILPSSGWATSIGISGDDIIFGMAATQGNGYYLFNKQSGKYTPMKIRTEGTPFRLLSFD